MAGAAARVVERGGCCRLRDCPLSMAAYWRVLRTLGGKNIGKCRLRAHQHPLLPPLSNLCQTTIKSVRCKTSKARRVMGDVLRVCAGVRAEDGLLPTSILDFRARLANRCKVLPVYALLRASILDFGARLANRCKVFPGNSPKAASILDFIHRLANQCSFLPGNASCTAVILDLRGSIWESLQHHRRSSEEWPA